MPLLQSLRLQHLVREFNPQYNLAAGLAEGIGWAGAALGLVYLRGQPFTTMLLGRLYAFAQFGQRLYPHEATLSGIVDWLRFAMWLESAEPLSSIQAVIERGKQFDDRSSMANAATQHLLFTQRYDEAREASYLWCTITEAWSRQEWQHFSLRRGTPRFKILNALARAFFQQDVETYNNRDVNSLNSALPKVNQLEKRRMLRSEGKLPPRPEAEMKEDVRLSGSMAEHYREAHLARALLEWSKDHNDVPAARLVARCKPHRLAMWYYMTLFNAKAAAAMGTSKTHYFRLVKDIAKSAKNDSFAPDLGAMQSPAPSPR